MRSPIRLAALLLVPLLLGCGTLIGLRPLRTAHAGQTSYHQIVVDGRPRTFLLHLPPAAAHGPVPLVLLFHGHHGSGALMREQSGMDEAADRRGIAVAYPDGTSHWRWLHLAWNATTCCGRAMRDSVDDVAFAQALVDTLERRGWVAPGRVAAAGFSAGGMLALRLACEHPETFVAAADVAGAMPDVTCRPARPVPVLLLQGEKDDELRFDLRTLRRPHSHRFAHSMEQALEFWAFENECAGRPARDSTTRFVRVRATGCPAGHGAELMTVYENPHAWPGSAQLFPGIGPQAARLDGSAVVLDFFARYGVGTE